MRDTSSNRQQAIIAYYNNTEGDYRWWWDLRKSLAMHFGYWDEKTRNLTDALRRLNEVLAETAHVASSDRVLDAGCGFGGSSIFLAKTLGCKVTGISLVPTQVQAAQESARKQDVADLTEFRVMDYLKTEFPDNSFDVVWAIESVCHTADKRAFVTEAFRVLKKGGKLIIADFFLSHDPATQEERTLLSKWLPGWALPSLATVDEFKQLTQRAGFHAVASKNITDFIHSSSLRLFLITIPGIVFGRVTEWLGIRNKIQTGNILAAHYQYHALTTKLAQYCIFNAEK